MFLSFTNNIYGIYFCILSYTVKKGYIKTKTWSLELYKEAGGYIHCLRQRIYLFFHAI